MVGGSPWRPVRLRQHGRRQVALSRLLSSGDLDRGMQPAIQFDCVWFQTELDLGFTETASRQRCGHTIDGRLHGGLRQASFNKTLFHAVGDAIGTEARAMSNVGAADGWTFW